MASDAQAADESEDGVCLLSAETAQSAVRALCDTAGLLLEYLENVLDDGTDVTGDPDTRLAVTRAVGSFLAELPDPHASRLDSILPRLLSHHATPGAMCPDQASRALTTRFMLPYLLQRTEDPHGLEAFERAKGPAALASLAERVISGNTSGDDGTSDGAAEIDAQEAVGVVAAVCATLRNAMEGTERGHAEEALAVDAAKAFADVAGTLSEWAERVLNDRTVAWREGGDVEDGTFLRGLQGLRRDGVKGAGAPGAWRQMLDFLRALVPAETDQLLIGANSFTSGGGAGYLSHSDGEEDDDETFDGEDAPVFDEDPELNAQVRAKFEAMRKEGALNVD